MPEALALVSARRHLCPRFRKVLHVVPDATAIGPVLALSLRTSSAVFRLCAAPCELARCACGLRRHHLVVKKSVVVGTKTQRCGLPWMRSRRAFGNFGAMWLFRDMFSSFACVEERFVEEFRDFVANPLPPSPHWPFYIHTGCQARDRTASMAHRHLSHEEVSYRIP